MNHDTDQLSALVDGELDHEDRDQLLGHLANCPECRQIVETERRLKALLGGLTDPQPEPSLAPVVGRVAQAVGPDPLETTRPRWLGPGPTLAAAATPGRRGASAQRSYRARRARYALGLMSVTGAFFSVAFAVGGEPDDSGPVVSPPVEQYSFEHAEISTGQPLSDPGAVTASFDEFRSFSLAGR